MADSQKPLSRQLLLMGHRNGPRLKSRSWITGGVAAGLVLLWLAWNSLNGECRLYQSGPLSTAHRVFENDCSKCHEPWGVVTSLWSNSIRSVPNQKCETCHAGSSHFEPLATGVSESKLRSQEESCVACHSEHDGHQSIAMIDDTTCTSCHSHLNSVAGHSGSFLPEISEFSTHPEFAVHRWANEPDGDPGIRQDSRHLAHTVVALLQRDGDVRPQWQDRSSIKFSHRKHLSPTLPGPEGPVDYSNRCDLCHMQDPQRAYFKPIVFEQHCQKCHPLVFDTEHLKEIATGRIVRISELPQETQGEAGFSAELNSKYALLTLPHESPAAVRGYLTDLYALRMSPGGPADSDSEAAQNPRRTIPSRPLSLHELAEDAKEEIRQRVQDAELFALTRTPEPLDHSVADQTIRYISANSLPGQMVRSLSKSGGCGFCHVVNRGESDASIRADLDGAAGPMWEITPPKIPAPISERITNEIRVPGKWFAHARFNHDAHRMVSCSLCHDRESDRAGDVLMPKIAVCRQCHTDRLSSAWKNADGAGARTDCLECHSYHHRQLEEAVDNPDRTLEALQKQ